MLVPAAPTRAPRRTPRPSACRKRRRLPLPPPPSLRRPRSRRSNPPRPSTTSRLRLRHRRLRREPSTAPLPPRFAPTRTLLRNSPRRPRRPRPTSARRPSSASRNPSRASRWERFRARTRPSTPSGPSRSRRRPAAPLLPLPPSRPTPRRLSTALHLAAGCASRASPRARAPPRARARSSRPPRLCGRVRSRPPLARRRLSPSSRRRLQRHRLSLQSKPRPPRRPRRRRPQQSLGSPRRAASARPPRKASPSRTRSPPPRRPRRPRRTSCGAWARWKRGCASRRGASPTRGSSARRSRSPAPRRSLSTLLSCVVSRGASHFLAVERAWRARADVASSRSQQGRRDPLHEPRGQHDRRGPCARLPPHVDGRRYARAPRGRPRRLRPPQRLVRPARAALRRARQPADALGRVLPLRRRSARRGDLQRRCVPAIQPPSEPRARTPPAGYLVIPTLTALRHAASYERFCSSVRDVYARTCQLFVHPATIACSRSPYKCVYARPSPSRSRPDAPLPLAARPRRSSTASPTPTLRSSTATSCRSRRTLPARRRRPSSRRSQPGRLRSPRSTLVRPLVLVSSLMSSH